MIDGYFQNACQPVSILTVSTYQIGKALSSLKNTPACTIVYSSNLENLDLDSLSFGLAPHITRLGYVPLWSAQFTFALQYEIFSLYSGGEFPGHPIMRRS
jgi:hypothetical protein